MSDALEFAIWKAINEGASRDLDRQKTAAAELRSAIESALATERALREAAESKVEALREALGEIAAMECVRGDGCDPYGHFGQPPDPLCAVCRARAALASPSPRPMPPEDAPRYCSDTECQRLLPDGWFNDLCAICGGWHHSTRQYQLAATQPRRPSSPPATAKPASDENARLRESIRAQHARALSWPCVCPVCADPATAKPEETRHG